MGLGSLFDDAFSSITTQVFNPYEVTTGIASSPVHAEDDVPNYINKTILASVIEGTDFITGLLDRAVNSSYPALNKEMIEASLLMGYSTNFTADFPAFIEQNLPTSFNDFPYGAAKTGTYIQGNGTWHGSQFKGKLRLHSWLLDYLWKNYQYDSYMNNLYSLTYSKNSWVGIKEIAIHVPGEVSDYREGFFLPIHEPGYFVATRDDVAKRDPVTVTYYPVGAGTGTGEAYTPPALSEPVVLNSGYVVPDLSEPVVLQSDIGGSEPSVPIDPYLVITYEWRDGGHRTSNPLQEGTITLPIPQWVITTEATYWQINANLKIRWSGYSNLIGVQDTRTWSSSTVRGHWLYEDGTGIYLAWDGYLGNLNDELSGNIDSRYVRPIAAGNYYEPGISGLKFIDPESEPGSFAAWETRAKAYGLPPVETLDQVKSVVDLTDAHRADFELAVELATTDAILLKYNYMLLSRWYQQLINTNLADFDNPDQMVYVHFGTSSLRRRYYFSGIARSTVTGKFSSEARLGQYFQTFGTYTETFYDFTKDESFSGTWTGMKYFFQKGENEYEILRLGHPMCVYYSRRGDTFGVEPTDERYVLPIHLDILKDMGGLAFDYVAHKALRYTHIVAVVRKISFMETEFFQSVMKFIQIGMQITFAITGIQGLAANLGVNLFVASVLYTAISFGVQAAIEFTVRELGIDNSLALAITIAVVGAAAGLNGNIFLDGLIDGAMLLQVANGLVTAVNEERMEKVRVGYQQLQYEQEEFGRYYEEQIKELEEARNLLGPQNVVNPFLFIGKVPMQIWGEGPQSFYERTIHSGNIGVKAFDFVHNYVEQQLRLPTLEDTVGDKLYGA
ncbi:hypothetical protein [Marinobacter shengliensis]|uniref:hypothetical protein n=1 Tax=Marinobacter shengliensis TaxID=1389223 RepID=UPI001E61FDC5|nr:hypothetical protein [Marinobacter shengliensis]MCD1628467.1 hypothetical protein [Marinobacter shengliensis]